MKAERMGSTLRAAQKPQGLSRGSRRTALLGASLLSAVAGATPAVAQESVLIAPTVPYDFDKGRNVSVTERARPDYDPLGINYGSFLVLPRVQAGVGYSNNAYLADDGKQDAAFVSLQPGFRINSGWSRHQLQVNGTGNFRRYLGESARNENGYSFGTRGRADFGLDYSFTGDAQFSKLYESPLSGDVQSNLSVLSSYRRSYFSGRGERRVGRTRLVAALDHTSFEFNPIDLASGTVIDQRDRDRGITRLIGQGEYAISPAMSTYLQASYDWTDYDTTLLNGDPNRDSRALRVLGGVNFDLTSFLRGTVGIGYVDRGFRSPLYKDVNGLSFEGRVEYFPTELTTFTVAARRLVADSSIGNSSAFFDNRASLRVDHELLRNLILNAIGEISVQDYIGSKQRSTNFRLSSGGRYLVNREFGLELALSYASRDQNNVELGNNFSEFSALVTVVYQR